MSSGIIWASGCLATWCVLGLAATLGILLIAHDTRVAAVMLRQFRKHKTEKGLDVGMMRPQFNLRRLNQLAWLALPVGIFVGLIFAAKQYSPLLY